MISLDRICNIQEMQLSFRIVKIIFSDTTFSKDKLFLFFYKIQNNYIYPPSPSCIMFNLTEISVK